MQSIDPLMRRFFVLHARMQQLFNAWDRRGSSQYEDAFTNVVDVDFLRRLQAGLAAPPMDDEALRQKLEDNFALLETFAATWQALAAECDPALARFVATERPASGSLAVVLQPVAALGSGAPARRGSHGPDDDGGVVSAEPERRRHAARDPLSPARRWRRCRRDIPDRSAVW